MIDIELIRKDKGGDLDSVYESEKKRFKSTELIDTCVELDTKWRVAINGCDTIRMKINENQDCIKAKKVSSKGKDACENEMKIKSELEEQLKTALLNEEELKKDFLKEFKKIGNIVHSSVPVDNNEDNNKVERTWGTVDTERKIDGKPGNAHHNEVLEWLGGYDPVRGNKLVGHRGYFLQGAGLLLNQALISYGMKFLMEKGYTPIQPPYFMKQDIVSKIAQLSDFDEQLYKVIGNPDSDPYYLIATAEQPICAMHMDEWLEESELPLFYGGFSSCFRKEAGAYGKDNWGIFRVHQFEKVEQFVICKPEDSWDMHEKMIACSEEFYQTLNLPYRVINIVSGALNDAAAKKYDLEAWFPGYGAYRELVSCSNCLDYQSRSAEIRLRKSEKDKKHYVHMLNGTLCATERTLCCILENYQTETGLKVPEVLQPFVGKDFLPFTNLPEKKEKKVDTKGKGKEKKEENKVSKEEKLSLKEEKECCNDESCCRENK